MELKLLTLMQPLLFPRKFKCGFSVTEPNTREARVPRGSDKKQTLRSECCSVIAVFAFQIFLQQQIMFIVWKLFCIVWKKQTNNSNWQIVTYWFLSNFHLPNLTLYCFSQMWNDLIRYACCYMQRCNMNECIQTDFQEKKWNSYVWLSFAHSYTFIYLSIHLFKFSCHQSKKNLLN